MPLFLVTCVCDEGVWPSSFKVFEAETRLDIAHHIYRNPEPWVWWLEKSKVWRPSREEQDCPPPEVLLRRIDESTMDGSSTWAFRIHEVRSVEAIPHHTATHPDG